MALTQRQKQVLDFLAKFITRRGYSPSFEEIGESLGLSSVATVHKHIENLERKGFIRRGYNQSRSIDVVAMPGPVPFGPVRRSGQLGRLNKTAAHARAGAVQGRGFTGAGDLPVSMEFPLLGRIAAGYPVEAFPATETFSLGDFARGRGDIFVLKVKGDSMIDDHICDGDYILVERSSEAPNGEIVVALVNGTDATLKRIFREAGGKVRLQPANAQMDPIVLPARSVRIQGRVIGVLRKY
ncbi:MAG: transcriptional repressor LexA [Terriglobia bacterium]